MTPPRPLPGAAHALAPEEQRIITADGARLHTVLHRPVGGESRGDVLIRTPYDQVHQRGTAASLTARGFRCWLQDVRGTHGSTGVFDPYRTEADDGVASVRHILARQDRPAPLLLMGSSYGATCALETAARVAGDSPTSPGCPASPAISGSSRRTAGNAPDDAAEIARMITGVIAIVPTIGRAETARALDGTPRVRDRFGWWHQHAFTSRMRRPLSPAQLDALTREAEEHGPVETARRHRDRLGWPPEQLDAWDQMWRQVPASLDDRFGDCEAPLLVVSGEQDFFADRAEPLRAAWGCRTAHQDSTLITGPWGHSLRGRDPDLGARIDRWIDGRLGPWPGGPHPPQTHEGTR